MANTFIWVSAEDSLLVERLLQRLVSYIEYPLPAIPLRRGTSMNRVYVTVPVFANSHSAGGQIGNFSAHCWHLTGGAGRFG